MVSLAEFPVPNNGYPTLCERSSQIINGNKTAGVLDYQKIPSEELTSQSKNLTVLESLSKPVFLPIQEALIERVYEKWKETGLVGVLEEINESPEVPKFMTSLVRRLHSYVKYVDEWRNKQGDHEDADEVRKGLLFACHPHTPRIAVVIQNKVKVMRLNRPGNDREVILRDKRIKQVTCLAWRPNASMSIAVGSHSGLLVWLLEPNFTGKRPGVSATRYLQSPEMTNEVTSISWNNLGNLLACTCKHSTTFWIWNIISQSSETIQRVGSSLNFSTWSPCGQRLLTSTQSGVFRIWETNTWDCAKWADLNGKCTNACWSSCGSYLLFTVENESVIYYTKFYSNKDGESIDIGGSGVAVKCAVLSEYSFGHDDDHTTVGGLIESLQWDPTNSRIAVMFKGNGNNQQHIALFHTQLKPQLQLIPCGFINGACDEFPSSIRFIHGYEKGALLAICWSNESLSLIPLHFNQYLSSPSVIKHNLTNESSVPLSATVSEEFQLNKTTVNDFSIYSTVE